MGTTTADAADRMAVTDVINRYAFAIDTRNFDDLNQVFDTEIGTDFSSFGGKPLRCTRQEWIDTVIRTVGGLDATQHLIGNCMHRIDGDTANMIAYLQAYHGFAASAGESEYSVGGYYDIDLTRTAAGWRISRYTLHLLWRRGNPEIIREAYRAMKAASA